jgi:hypothetical protein
MYMYGVNFGHGWNNVTNAVHAIIILRRLFAGDTSFDSRPRLRSCGLCH